MIILKQNSIYTGKCERILPYFQESTFDSLVTDAPYGFGDEPDPVEVMTDWIAQGFHQVSNKGGFMGKEWDAFVPQPLTFKSAYRVLKPGAHALVCCGTRTIDWMMQSLRFAGFEIRDVIPWHYGTGFPKSMNISKAIDKAAGAEREVIGVSSVTGKRNNSSMDDGYTTDNRIFTNNEQTENLLTAPATDEAKLWDGYGTALKPATELWILARKPIAEKTIAKNILKWGTGGLNINACRIPFAGADDFNSAKFGRGTEILGGNYVAGSNIKSSGRKNIEAIPIGRWPANVILDPFMAEMMDRQSPVSGAKSPVAFGIPGNTKGKFDNYQTKGNGDNIFYGDTGGASRFFYCAKPSEYERHHGLEKFTGEFPKGNDHVTVKPVELMRWLVKLITPKNGLMLDCFCGSGSTLIGAKLENINYVGIDMDRRNCRISELRVNAWNPEKYKAQTLFD